MKKNIIIKSMFMYGILIFNNEIMSFSFKLFSRGNEFARLSETFLRIKLPKSSNGPVPDINCGKD